MPIPAVDAGIEVKGWTMSDPKGQDDYGRIDADRRLDSLDQRLDRLESSEAQRTGRNRGGEDPNYRLGSRVLADLIGGIAGGALVGWVIDRLVGTWPWGFLIFLFLGIVVAFRNILRIAGTTTPNTRDPDAGE